MICLYPSLSRAWMRTLLPFSLCCSQAMCRPAGGAPTVMVRYSFFSQSLRMISFMSRNAA